ncbi:MAG: relaxase/mobilization nuclease domain-containing protein [Methylocystaceae bacterium]|nr:relaxase/mobilization nuclease domain-containing protein [Methylocystaceae bacterium]
MIAKKVKPHPNDTYGKLADYIAAAKEKGEKLHSLWMEEFNAGTEIEDLDLAILEAHATQKLNNRVKGTKTYHLMISFREEDRIPDPDELKEIEREFAKALGFEEHQRVVGCHQNTNNFHMHVAYNRIHPETLRAHSPEWDFYKLAEVCEKLELNYDLSPDHNKEKEMSLDDEKEKDNAKAKDKEAHTWEESFDSYVKRHKVDIRKDLKAAEGWQSFHEAMDQYDIRFKPRGAGLIIEDAKGKHRVKASALGREFSKKALEDKFGPYQAYKKHHDQAQKKKAGKSRKKDSYKPRPITKHPKTQKYWKRYIGAKNGKQALVTKAFKNFKEFLQYEALDDPLAMAIIQYQKKMADAVFSPIEKLGKKSTKQR